jgi:hypothetical protein
MAARRPVQGALTGAGAVQIRCSLRRSGSMAPRSTQQRVEYSRLAERPAHMQSVVRLSWLPRRSSIRACRLADPSGVAQHQKRLHNSQCVGVLLMYVPWRGVESTFPRESRGEPNPADTWHHQVPAPKATGASWIGTTVESVMAVAYVQSVMAVR